jgi:hypothetical protein
MVIIKCYEIVLVKKKTPFGPLGVAHVEGGLVDDVLNRMVSIKSEM